MEEDRKGKKGMPTVMAGQTTKGPQFDGCQLKTKMNKFLSAERGDFIKSYSEVHETFDLMGLMENLSRSIHAYVKDTGADRLESNMVLPGCMTRVDMCCFNIVSDLLKAHFELHLNLIPLTGYVGSLCRVWSTVSSLGIHGTSNS
ncbi:hypothetical protein LguiA_026248 [Lonicera macranthoides]